MTTFITILMSILNLVMMNPNIPQETKDQIFSQTITAINEGFKTPAIVSEPVAPVTMSAPMEPTYVAPVATSTATTTQYVAGTVRTSGHEFVFDRNDADVFKYEIRAVKINGKHENGNHVNHIAGKIPQTVDSWGVSDDIEGTLWVFSSRKGQVLDERTYNFKVEGGVATLY